MTFDELDDAVNVGVEASHVLSEVLQELVDKHHCPEAEGSEGWDTFPECGECVYCLAKRLYKAYRLPPWSGHKQNILP